MNARVLRQTAAAALTVAALSGCETVPFRSDGRAASGVIGLGAASPYVSAPPPPGPEPSPPPNKVAGAPLTNVYAAAKRYSPAVKGIPVRLFAPHGRTVTVLDPRTGRATARLRTPATVRRVVPSWDLTTLWLTGPKLLQPVDARTLKPGKNLKPPGPFALYFTPDGLAALTFTGRRLEFRDPHTLKLRTSMRLPCALTGAADFSADGSHLTAACHRTLLRIDWLTARITARAALTSPTDQITLSPDGTAFYLPGPTGVRIYNSTDLTPRPALPTKTPVTSLLLTRAGTTLYTTTPTSLTAYSLPSLT
ncbi:YncE family protein, partial [Actinocorallia lasiicapitis]